MDRLLAIRFDASWAPPQKTESLWTFSCRWTENLGFVCGDFIGDTRKGILTDGETADVEATFHFDHLFGDGDAPADDEINTGALGFGPIAALAENGEVSLTSNDLEQNLNKERLRGRYKHSCPVWVM